MISTHVRRAALGAVVCSLLAVPGAEAQRPTRDDQLRPTELLSRGPNGEAPNAPVSEPVLSQDERVSQYAAYVTAATNIVANSGAFKNAYLVKRKRPWGQNGTPWNFGSTQLISKGIGGPANGDSWSVSLSGTDFHNPKCMVFVSNASNLVRGDSNGRADVFHANLPSGKLTRFAGNAPVTEAVTEGSCEYFGYVAGGSLYLKRDGEKVKRIARGGVTNPHISVEGRVITYERGGWIYGYVPAYRGKPTRLRKVAKGTNHTVDFYGRYVSFQRGDAILRADVLTAPRVRSVPRSGGPNASGRDPVMTGGGGWVWWGSGAELLVNIRERVQGRCGANGLAPGNVEQPDTSPHGNYAVFICTNGPAYLLYEGPK